MIILLLTKITKLSWIEQPEFQSVVQNLFKLQTMNNERLTLLSLTALHDLIIEMTYIHKLKHLNVSRRVSVAFREISLTDIFTQSLQSIDHFINQV